ncbi:hypothetical protein AWB80_07523 [Caballeronia pedi]|uniref:Uncharacterized protein n=1 Tax=Caballeronia pedi TaxID=1777141 RepID=A0A158DV04_9BURK|nr:hypothetical protein [Caballeronia pedi]SAK98451.1 hypothetical protein AWB80_07523 [Caballeronia pedi]
MIHSKYFTVGSQLEMNIYGRPMIDGRQGFARVVIEITSNENSIAEYVVRSVVARTDYGFEREIIGSVGGFRVDFAHDDAAFRPVKTVDNETLKHEFKPCKRNKKAAYKITVWRMDDKSDAVEALGIPADERHKDMAIYNNGGEFIGAYHLSHSTHFENLAQNIYYGAKH